MDCYNELKTLRTSLERKKGQRELLLEKKVKHENAVEELDERIRDLQEARNIVQAVAKEVQKRLEYKTSELVTLALSNVFPDPYSFKVEFSLRRNRTEADMSFERDGQKMSPMEASGGGVVDIASFALRLTMWSMSRPRSAPVMFLDEPFRFVSKEYQSVASSMLKEVSKKLGIQLLIVTHEQNIMESADKRFSCVLIKGRSQVREEGANAVADALPRRRRRA